jgi:hypothetical protein
MKRRRHGDCDEPTYLAKSGKPAGLWAVAMGGISSDQRVLTPREENGGGRGGEMSTDAGRIRCGGLYAHSEGGRVSHAAGTYLRRLRLIRLLAYPDLIACAELARRIPAD